MELDALRMKIDDINHQMVKLFVERMNVSMDIAKYKIENGLPVLDKERERSILNRMALEAGEPFEDYTQVLFSTLFELSRSYQSSLMANENVIADRIKGALNSTPALFPRRAVVACQGVEGAYSQQACDKLFPHAEIVYVQSFDGVFQAVEKGLCRYGILPIENSSFGSVGSVYDLMKKHHFSIVRSTRLRIAHALLAKRGVGLKNIREIFSHEQAIGQCSEFLKSHPEIKVTVCANTAMAAKMVSESNRDDVAAISSRQCAEIYELEVLSESIQNSDNNFTRFICISRELEIYPGASKISLMMTLPHSTGSLSGMLSRFSMMGINLTKLESRPIPDKDFEFMFYFDLEASVCSEAVLRLLCELQNNPGTFVFLGNYIDA
ncbi:MAG: bifunctional chorismate mutase/prephenate dehydratase [Oscillospiraceae bacterium]|jgi:chorismate mutase/prephenate dehydratase|nr:bifunctional chorismate mutase/prephenate dehydratase [Oscillospiraceae bacterium]